VVEAVRRAKRLKLVIATDNKDLRRMHSLQEIDEGHSLEQELAPVNEVTEEKVPER
jgi:hypothetical protein